METIALILVVATHDDLLDLASDEVLKPMPDDIEHFTDLGNSNRLVNLHGDDLRFCHTWSKWMVWDGAHWKSDSSADVMRRARDTVASIYGEAADSGDADTRKAIATWATLPTCSEWSWARPTGGRHGPDTGAR